MAKYLKLALNFGDEHIYYLFIFKLLLASPQAQAGFFLFDKAFETVFDLKLISSLLATASLLPLPGNLAPLVPSKLLLLLQEPQILLRCPFSFPDSRVQEVEPTLTALFPVPLSCFESLI